MKCHNPFGFRPGPVTFWAVVVYAAFFIPLIYVHETVPPVPRTTPAGINLTEAWHDLTTITQHFHPYNSQDNERVGAYILERIEAILTRNGVGYTKETTGGVDWTHSLDVNGGKPAGAVHEDGSGRAANWDSQHSGSSEEAWDELRKRQAAGFGSDSPAATIFDDNTSNVTFNDRGGYKYFEGTNKMIYLRGTEDEPGKWWQSKNREIRTIGKGGVLVNSHYDSVSSGYGATDDGMGVVSMLQMLNYFTTEGRQPKRGIVFLFNNAEEDWLYGAHAFAYSPVFSFPTTFVNLEGAGAGGRAMLFRATDKEVIDAYKNAPHPFGSITTSDLFGLGLIQSGTDYQIWNEDFGMRGIDVAFYRPRARYHTNQDDTRHASRDSLWHMLSNSLPAVENMANDASTTFVGPRRDGDRGKIPSGKATHGVWFDIFGKGFAVLNLRGLFAWALTLLIVSPLVLVLISYVLVKKDKYYLFSGKINVHNQGSEDPVHIGGLRGLTRFVFCFVVATALAFGSSLLIHKVNPLIIYSSEYAVWSTVLSTFFVVYWTLSKGSSVIRPSALQRAYTHIWLFIISWAILVAVAVFADRFKIGALFPFVFLHSSTFVATVIALLELFALPPKQEFAQRAHDEHQTRDQFDEVAAGEAADSAPRDSADYESEEPSETTPLRSSERRASENQHTTFGTTYRRSISAVVGESGKANDGGSGRHQPFEGEQSWSGRLPAWTWILQFLLLGPINIILLGQLALVVVSSTNISASEGANDLVTYLAIAGFGALLLLPLTPFLHRVTFHVTLFLLAVFAGTLIYNLVAFPFSANNRYKVYFQQTVDLETGESRVALDGIEEYVRAIIRELPSATGQDIACGESDQRTGLTSCSWNGAGILPNLIPPRSPGNDSHSGTLIPGNDGLSVEKKKKKKHDRFDGLVSANATLAGDGSNIVTVHIDAHESKWCHLKNLPAMKRAHVRGGNELDPRFSSGDGEEAATAITLSRRVWDTPWTVDVELVEAPPSDLSIGVWCQWDDANTPDTIPAFDEALQFSPDWAAFTKVRQGLVRADTVVAVAAEKEAA